MAKSNISRRTSNNSHRVYINGNTVRKTNNNPGKYEKRNFTIITNPKYSPKLNPIGIKTLIISAMFGIAVFSLALFHLNLQASITASTAKLKKIETECADLEQKNKDAYRDLLATINLNEIREDAINDYGMVYSNQNQTRLLNKNTSNYIMQYSEIPMY